MTNWTPSGFLTVNGKALEYACFGPAPNTAPTIIMLHEGLGCVALWRDFPERLAAETGLGVVAYSRAGYGQSDPTDLPRSLDYMTHEAIDVLPQIVDVLGIEKAVLLGHSDGATIATIYAGSVEDFRIRGLIVMAPHYFTEAMGLKEIAKAKVAFETADLGGKLAKYHKDPNTAFYGWNDSWLHPEFRKWNVAESIDYLRIPTLAIQGVGDQYGTVAQIQELEDRSYAPVDVVMLENCKHAPFVDQPNAVLANVTDFVTRLLRIEAAKVDTL